MWKNPDDAGVLFPLHSQAPAQAKAKHLSKTEWLRAAQQASARQGGANGMLPGFGQIAVSKDALFGAVGPPSDVQMVGGDVLLYWECSDGTIQISTSASAYNYAGQVVGRLNAY
jgi:hypothetical protein